MIREAGPEDFDGVMRLYRQMHPKDPPAPDGPARFAEIVGAPGLRLFVLEADGEIVATTYLNVIPNLTRGAASYAVIENVVVDEARRGTGLGKALMAGTLQEAWNAGCYKVMLMTGSSNPAVHGFYRACGFSADDKSAYVARPA